MSSTTLTRPPTSAAQPPQRRRWLPWLVIGLAVVLLAGTGWLVGFSSVLAVRTVEVSGVRILEPEQVRSVAQVRSGVPLVRQDLGGIAARVARLAPVETVRVERRWPDTVLVDVTERTPVILLKAPTGYVLADRSGVVFDTVPKRPENLPLAEISRTDTVTLSAVAEMAGELPGTLLKRTRAIRATSTSAIVLELTSGVRVTWGTADETPLKAQIVLTLLKQKPRQIDVSSPHNPATR